MCKQKIIAFFTTQRILSFTLAFVVIWFGVNEILSPKDWVVFAPAFLGSGQLAINSVLLHGIVLSACGVFLVFNFCRRGAALMILLLLMEIIILLIVENGLSDIAVRDIGLWGIALAIAIKKTT